MPPSWCNHGVKAYFSTEILDKEKQIWRLTAHNDHTERMIIAEGPGREIVALYDAIVLRLTIFKEIISNQ